MPSCLYQVCISRNGLISWDVRLPGAKGTMYECVRFIETHNPPKGPYQFELVNLDTKHAIHNFEHRPEKFRMEVRWDDLVARRW